MTRLAERKTRLSLITNQTARYRGQDRAVVVEVSPEIATLRLLGTRTRYEVSWRGVFDYAAAVLCRSGAAPEESRARGEAQSFFARDASHDGRRRRGAKG